MVELHAIDRAPHDPGGSLAAPASASTASSWMRPRNPSEQASDPVRTPKGGTALFPPLRQLARRLIVMSLLFLALFPQLIASWSIIQPSTAFALAFKNPN